MADPLGSVHNYAACNLPVCELCDAYADGYSDGKRNGVFDSAIAVAHFEESARCECAPCVQLRSVLLDAMPPAGEYRSCTSL